MIVRALVMLWLALAPTAPRDEPPMLETPAFQSRLAALTPDQPEKYFLLGEELAAEARSPRDIAVAQQLLALAFLLDSAPERSAGQVCVALADLEPIRERRDWLLAIAGAYDPRYAATDWSRSVTLVVSDETALAAATCLGQTRAGEGLRALELLDKPGVREVLEEYEPLLGTTGHAGAMTRLETQMRVWPCPECRNRRVVNRNTPAGVEPRLCNTCQGDPGPDMEQSELVAHLRLELRLLSGIQRSWSGQLAADRGAPLLDPDPRELGASLTDRHGVSPSKPLWRKGQWTGTDSN